MSSVPQIETHVREVFGEWVNHLAQETGCIKRHRKLTGQSLLLLLVFGWMRDCHASLESFARLGQQLDVSLTDTAVHKRFTPECATFLQRVLEQVSQRVVPSEPVPNRLLRRFSAVLLEDSSTVSLPDSLREVWRGCGGAQGTSGAAVKLHTRLDLVSGQVQGPCLTDAREPDRNSPLREQEGPEGSLLIADLAYFALPWLQQLDQSNRRFLVRLKAKTALYTRGGHRLDLRGLLPPQEGHWITYGVLLGAQARLPVRLMIVRVPHAVADQRREELHENAKRQGVAVSEEHLHLVDWTILVTNVPARLLSLPDALVLMRQRWQIERLFRRWKMAGQIDEWRTKQQWRMLCELYAKLIGELLVHWLCVAGCWHDLYRSLDKASQEVHEHAVGLLQALATDQHLSEVIASILRGMQSGCQLTMRSSSSHSAHLLVVGIDWPLTPWFGWHEHLPSACAS